MTARMGQHGELQRRVREGNTRQLSILDQLKERNASGEERRDAAIDQVADSHAAWIHKVVTFIRGLGPITFTTDDLWKAFAHPSEPRAMGAAIREARRLGFIKATGEYVKSTRAACHARPIPVWRRAT